MIVQSNVQFSFLRFLQAFCSSRWWCLLCALRWRTWLSCLSETGFSVLSLTNWRNCGKFWTSVQIYVGSSKLSWFGGGRSNQWPQKDDLQRQQNLAQSMLFLWLPTPNWHFQNGCLFQRQRKNKKPLQLNQWDLDSGRNFSLGHRTLCSAL